MSYPFVGPPGDRLYKVGLCRVCDIALFDDKRRPRDVCGLHLTEMIGDGYDPRKNGMESWKVALAEKRKQFLIENPDWGG
jgi:hypothetical protein